MHLTCPDCGAAIAADDINIERGIAKCRACNAVVDMAEQVHAKGGIPRFLQRPRVPQPKRITVEDLGDGLRLTRRWFTWAVLLPTFCCVFGAGLLLLWSSMLVAGEMRLPWLMAACILIGVPVVLLMIYLTLIMYLNRSVLEVRDGRLTVRHGPLPWLGQRNLDTNTSDVEQLFCQERFSTYNVKALLKGGQRVTLLERLPNCEQALFIEQVVEGCLGIEDRQVGGELARP